MPVPLLLRLVLAVALAAGLTTWACVQGPSVVPQHGWWAGHGPVVPHRDFPGDCSICHTTASWTALRADFAFDHAAETGFALVGAHDGAQCLRCHNDRGPVGVFAARGCAGCHPDPHQGRMGRQCTDCHDEADWRPDAQLADHARTRLPLFGAHASVTCDRCHPGLASGIVEPLNPACEACHQADLEAAREPDHFAQGWVQDCQDCHLPTTWSEDGFRHEGFPLTGAHGVIACEACHDDGSFSTLPGACVLCHLDDYQGVRDPDHVFFGYPQDCERCHDDVAFAGAVFDHSWVTRACVDCHVDDYAATRDPNHTLAGYPQRCEDCHVTRDWRAATFDHAGIVDGCVDCHFQNYLHTSDPPHQVNGYPQTCEICHDGTESWPPVDYDHAGVRDGCVQCHLQDYLGTEDPDHVAQGFPKTCELCHGTEFWKGSRPGAGGRGRGEAGKRPRDGAHFAGTSCEACHPED